MRIAQSESGPSRVSALELLGTIGAKREQESIVILQSQLQSKSPQHQLAALRSLHRLGARAVTNCYDTILNLLKSKNTEVALAAVDTLILSELKWKDSLSQTILAWLEQDRDQSQKIKAVWAAGHAKKENADRLIAPLLAMLSFQQGDNKFLANESRQRRQSLMRNDAAEALGRLANEAPDLVVPKLLLALADQEDPKKREGAARAFQYLQSQFAGKVIGPLCTTLENKDELYMVRLQALQALMSTGKADVTRAAKAIVPLVGCGDDRLAVEGALALGRLGQPAFDQAREQMEEWTALPTAHNRRAVAIGLAAFASEGVTDDRLGAMAIRLQRDEAKVVRDAAMEATGEWLRAKYNGHRMPGACCAALLGELQSDRSQMESSYRASLVYALSRSLKTSVDTADAADSAILQECQSRLAHLRETGDEAWIRAAAFQASQ